MATVFFSDGTTAEVEDVRSEDPRTFLIPNASYSTFAEAFAKQATIQFGRGGPVYLLKQMKGNIGTAILQVRRR